MKYFLILLLLVPHAGMAATPQDYAKLAETMSSYVGSAGDSIARFERTYKKLQHDTPGFRMAAASYLWLNLLGNILLLESTVVGAPSKMPDQTRPSFTSLADSQLRFSNKNFETTVRILRAGAPSLPTQELVAIMQEALGKLDEGHSFVGNFYSLHGELQPGDPVNAEIAPKK